jgi:hypothetical protein
MRSSKNARASGESGESGGVASIWAGHRLAANTTAAQTTPILKRYGSIASLRFMRAARPVKENPTGN